MVESAWSSSDVSFYQCLWDQLHHSICARESKGCAYSRILSGTPINAFFATRQCVKKWGTFDCRRFMSHKWWLAIHLPSTCTHKTHTHQPTDTHFAPSSDFIHWPWRICAGSLTHAYLHWTHTNSPTQQAISKGYCVCLFVRPFTYPRL